MYTKPILLVATCALWLSACGGSGNAEFETPKEQKYIVVFKQTAAPGSLSASASKAGALRIAAAISAERELYAERLFTRVLQGGVYRMDEEQAEDLRQDPRVAYVEEDRILSINGVQAQPPWGLDRIDQANLPLNQSYSYDDSGVQVNAYVIDTGVLTTHQEFQGRAVSGFDFVNDDADATDCNGHGTHVAGTIGGATYGVAKNVKIYGVRVLDCQGFGSTSDVIAGIEWVTNNHIKPAVANMSLGGSVSQAIDQAVQASIAAGVTFVVAAGNENQNACNVSPARVPGAITVGSTTSSDSRSSFSNFGTCVDVFAPGSDIASAWYSSPTATRTISGTSMASPHVAGAVALYLSLHPQALPGEVASQLAAGAVPGKVSNPGTGSPNLLLNTGFVSANPNPNPNPEPDPKPQPGGALKNGETVTDLSGAKGSEIFFSIEVPAGAANLNITISGGSGDADLYLRAASKPSDSVYECRPYLSGNSESCTVANPQPGTYHIRIKAYAAYSGVSLKASYGAGNGNTSQVKGDLSGKGDFDEPPEYQAAAGVHRYALKGPANADFDLYLYKKNGSAWTQVASALSSTSTESLNYTGAAGTYKVKVISFSGSGGYELTVTTP